MASTFTDQFDHSKPVARPPRSFRDPNFTAVEVLRGDGALAKVDVHALPWIQPTGHSNLRRFYKAQNEEIEQLQADETLLLSAPCRAAGTSTARVASTASLTGGASADEERDRRDVSVVSALLRHARARTFLRARARPTPRRARRRYRDTSSPRSGSINPASSPISPPKSSQQGPAMVAPWPTFLGELHHLYARLFRRRRRRSRDAGGVVIADPVHHDAVAGVHQGDGRVGLRPSSSAK